MTCFLRACAGKQLKLERKARRGLESPKTHLMASLKYSSDKFLQHGLFVQSMHAKQSEP